MGITLNKLARQRADQDPPGRGSRRLSLRFEDSPGSRFGDARPLLSRANHAALSGPAQPAPSQPAHLSNHHRNTLRQIFHHTPSSSLPRTPRSLSHGHRAGWWPSVRHGHCYAPLPSGPRRGVSAPGGGLDPIPPPNREDETMQDTVDQAHGAVRPTLAGHHRGHAPGRVRPLPSRTTEHGRARSPAPARPGCTGQTRRQRRAGRELAPRLLRDGDAKHAPGCEFNVVGPRRTRWRMRSWTRQNGQVGERVGQQRPQVLGTDELPPRRPDISPVYSHARLRRADQGCRVASSIPAWRKSARACPQGPRPRPIRCVPSPSASARIAQSRESGASRLSPRRWPHPEGARRRHRGHRKHAREPLVEHGRRRYEALRREPAHGLVRVGTHLFGPPPAIRIIADPTRRHAQSGVPMRSGS
jgi:hypothetical protein